LVLSGLFWQGSPADGMRPGILLSASMNMKTIRGFSAYP
jgi:hypothetical protein